METKNKLISYLSKISWVIIFILFGLCFIVFEKILFSSIFGQVFLVVFMLALVFWSRGAVNRYKSWKVRMYKNNKHIKLSNWFRF